MPENELGNVGTPADTATRPPIPNPYKPTNEYPRPETGPNWPLLNATRDLIASLPRPPHAETFAEARDAGITDQNGWVQADWRCATGMCFAGWATALTGARFLYPADEHGEVEYIDEHGCRAWTERRFLIEDTNGKQWNIRAYARHALGLNSYDSSDLFRMTNTLGLIDSYLNVWKSYG